MAKTPPDDSSDFEALDAYLHALQEGIAVDRERFLRDYPHLASMVDCLDALECAAPSHESIASLESGDAIGGGQGENDSWGAPALPSEFGRYELIAEIGRGGMGVVYKAKQSGLDRTVAVKMIQPTFLSSEQHVSRFLAEAKAAAQLQHPSIVHIHEVGQIHGQHYFAMEYVEGMGLDERIRSGPIEIDEAVRLVARIARAVDYLHQQGVVHRDLKPSNILLDRDENPYLTDFGLAKTRAASDQTATNAVLGTPSYMAPEQASARREEIGPLSDVYGLGAILYELLTKHPPFREDTPLDTLMQVMTGEPRPPRLLNSSIPQSLELICLKCLDRSPQARYESAGRLADDLDHYLMGESLEVHPPSLLQRTWRWMRREAALSLRLVVLAAFFGIETTNFAFGAVGTAFHEAMLMIIGAWLAFWVVVHLVAKRSGRVTDALYLWGVIDASLLFAVLMVADGVFSSIVVGIPLLILGAGLWLRERLVWMMTGLSVLIYGLLVVDLFCWRPFLLEGYDNRIDRHVIFVVVLVTTGVIIAHLVRRFRALSRYLGRHE